MQICPDCNIELDPDVHKFCFGCGKTIQQIRSIVSEKRGKCIIFSLHLYKVLRLGRSNYHVLLLTVQHCFLVIAKGLPLAYMNRCCNCLSKK